MSERRRIAVIGLGYVGLPVAVAFARKGFAVVGFEINKARVEELKQGRDRTGEVGAEDLAAKGLTITSDPAALKAADFYIITVPTPIDDALVPDLRAVHAASKLVGVRSRKATSSSMNRPSIQGAPKRNADRSWKPLLASKPAAISRLVSRPNGSIPAIISTASRPS